MKHANDNVPKNPARTPRHVRQSSRSVDSAYRLSMVLSVVALTRVDDIR